MILIDANLLLYAYGGETEHESRARTWLSEIFLKREPIRLAWLTILAFLRLSTSPRVFKNPLSIIEAVSIVSEWLARPGVAILNPGERHWTILSKLLPTAQVRGPLVMDAHLAALAIEHGAILCTHDKDFARFPNLRVEYPLEAR